MASINPKQCEAEPDAHKHDSAGLGHRTIAASAGHHSSARSTLMPNRPTSIET
jgi:hypothetical protein